MKHRRPTSLKVTCYNCHQQFTMRVSTSGTDRATCWHCNTPYVAYTNVMGGIKVESETVYGQKLNHLAYVVTWEGA
jgi:hypothetical protein